MSRLTLALDVMGGDVGPHVTIPASIKALEQDPMLSLMLFGDSQQILPLLTQVPTGLKSRLSVCHCSRVIENNQGLSYAIRHSKGTSMRLAIEAVKNGEAQGCVSAGNTGALMGLSKVLLQPISGIERPALVSMLPTMEGKQTVMLDLGANIECSAENLYQFALMGSIFAENRFGLVFPRIALLNIGIEEIKGYKSIRQAADIIKKDTRLNYVGFIEGDILLNGKTDVIVTDGFIGNIALKTLEGAAKNLISLFKTRSPSTNPSFLTIFKQKIISKLKKRFLRSQIAQLENINPDKYNGASLIGLTAVVVKSHGSANINAFSYAILDAASQVRQQIPTKILMGLQKD